MTRLEFIDKIEKKYIFLKGCTGLISLIYVRTREHSGNYQRAIDDIMDAFCWGRTIERNKFWKDIFDYGDITQYQPGKYNGPLLNLQEFTEGCAETYPDLNASLVEEIYDEISLQRIGHGDICFLNDIQCGFSWAASGKGQDFWESTLRDTPLATSPTPEPVEIDNRYTVTKIIKL